MESLIEHLERWVALKPDACLYSFLDGRGREKERYSYRAFDLRTRFLAEWFSGEIGVRFGDRVLLAYPPGLEIVAAFFACARIGAIPVPVAPPMASRARAIESIARDCGAEVALTTRTFLDSRAGGESHPRMPQPARWFATEDRAGHVSHDVRDNPNAVLFLQYTSGSTSDPKGVVVSHENVVHNARSTIDHEPVGVSWLPQHHDMGLIGYQLFPVVMGGRTTGIAPLDFLRRPWIWLQAMSRERATYASAPNFAYEYCLRDAKMPATELAGVDLSSVRVLMNASERVDADTFRRFAERFSRYGLNPKAHVVAYGLAENTLAATLHGSRIMSVDEPAGACTELVSCGRPLRDVELRVVDPASHSVLDERQVGEVWLSGPAVCRGYWQRPALTHATFGAVLAGADADGRRYLRTGDLGFLHEGELFICGRIKDVIIIRGINYFPEDIERVVASVSRRIRAVVALAGEDPAEPLEIVAEVDDADELPEPLPIVHEIRAHHAIVPRTIAFVAGGSLVRTTSGKIARGPTHQRWRNGELRTLATFSDFQQHPATETSAALMSLKRLLRQLAPSGQEQHTLAELGVESLTLLELLALVRAVLAERGISDVGDEVDLRLLQAMPIAELLALERSAEAFSGRLRQGLQHAQREHERRERRRMRKDARLASLGSPGEGPMPAACAATAGEVLLTGATGFFGPFLLASLLQRTSSRIHVLIRAANAEQARGRVHAALLRSGLLNGHVPGMLDERVRIVCGDLSRARLGLARDEWQRLGTQVDAIIHNGAAVNYLLAYEALRPHNVAATRELLKLAASGVRKAFHFISSTFIFGWTAQATLRESDCNARMENLDFGYSQTKWVAEQLVLGARRQGLPARIYRPSLISASTGGLGSREDIAVRLLSFMINHGIAVRAANQLSFLPADIVADDIAAIIGQAGPDDGTLHVTADSHYSMMDVTLVLARDYGYRFEYYDIPGFVDEMNRRCTKEDPLYPLLEFFNRSHARISRMQGKRYDNSGFRSARLRASGRRHDPPLEQTVAALVAFMSREGLIRLPAPVAAAG